MRDGDSVGGEAMRALHVADLGVKRAKKEGPLQKAAPTTAWKNERLRTRFTP